MTDKVGFIGLGNMGGPMARNLLKAGVALVVHDIDPRKVQALAEAGAEVGASPQAIARETTRTICMVETAAQVEAVVMGETGLIRAAKPGHVVISMSTADLFKLREMEPKLAALGIGLLDAPVSGGTRGAAEGSLSIMVGGDKALFDACADLFHAMGANVFHAGGLGNGLAMKLINNMLIHVNTIAVAEAMVMGAKAGLDIKQLFDMVSVSSGNSYAFQDRGRKMMNRTFGPSGTVDISYKDQELETGLAKSLGVPAFMASVSQQVYQMARAMGFNKQDGAAVVQVYERLVGVEVKA
jgi:3-hydroxyisobutyrate dehydrogenase